jgi:hypothetical protein
MHDAVMAEFGDSHTGDDVGGDASREAVVSADPDLRAEATTDDVELVETSQPQDAEIMLDV